MNTSNIKAKGFSLIEILVVLVIISMLAGLVVPSFLRRADEARIQKVEVDFNTLATALSLYKLDNGFLPGSDQGLEALQVKSRLSPQPLNWKPGGYLSSMPVDPWGNNYLYLYPAEISEKEYDLFSFGANGRRGGEEQDADRYR